MGYSTDFDGCFSVTPPLAPEHAAYLAKFAETRRMKRDPAKVADLPDPIRKAVGLPVGEDGGYYIGSAGDRGQSRTPDVINYNTAPAGQPGLWCQWVPTPDGTGIEWDEGEKFDAYTEWLTYLIEHFLKPWGYRIDGEVGWHGEDDDDIGRIFVRNNIVEAVPATITRPTWDDPPQDEPAQPDPPQEPGLSFRVDSEPVTVVFGPTTPTPDDFTLSIELTWLSRDAGIAVAEARIQTTQHHFSHARWYWLKVLIGPDGHHALDTQLVDAVSFHGGSTEAVKQHAFTYDEIIAAVRERWTAERGS